MGDLEQFELRMLRRDAEIDSYDRWWYEEGGQLELEVMVFETLLSWFEFEEYCIRCGEHKSAMKTDQNQQWYQLECKHYAPRWDKDHIWDDEMGWVPK